MNTLLEDNIIEIIFHLNDRDKINFLSINASFRKLINNTYFEDKIHYEVIQNLWYINRFRNLIIDDTNSIPAGITHLTFGDRFFNQDIKDYIPSSVTHLTFG